MFVQKPYLRTNYIEAIIEEDIELKGQYRIETLPDPTSIREPAPNYYVDNLFNDPSIIKNTGHKDLNDGNITNARFIQVDQLPQIDSHFTAKLYVYNAIDDTSLIRNNKDKDFGNYNLTNINSITLNKQVENDNEVITKAYVDQFHQENERNRRDLGINFYDESNDLVENNQDNNDLNDKKLTKIDSVVVSREPTSDNELAGKKYVDHALGGGNISRFAQTLKNFLIISVGNDTYNLTKYNKNQLTDTTIMKTGNGGGYLLPSWRIFCNDKNNNGKITNFSKSTKTNSPTSDSRATSLPPISSAFIYIETSSNNHGSNVFVSWERTDLIQISNITFYYNRFSAGSTKSMGRFRIQLSLEDNTWSTRYNIPKNDR